MRVYIPHSSDKTGIITIPPSGISIVYIPHSSDKTMTEQEFLEKFLKFTSLIVQIRLFLTIIKDRIYESLHPS